MDRSPGVRAPGLPRPSTAGTHRSWPNEPYGPTPIRQVTVRFLKCAAAGPVRLPTRRGRAMVGGLIAFGFGRPILGAADQSRQRRSSRELSGRSRSNQPRLQFNVKPNRCAHRALPGNQGDGIVLGYE